MTTSTATQTVTAFWTVSRLTLSVSWSAFPQANASAPNYLNMSLPPSPFLAWTLHVNDKSGEWTVTPLGHQNVSIILFALLISIPLITAFIAAAIFRYSFYAIKVNKWGIKPTKETNYFQLGADKKDATMASTAPMAAMSEKPGKNAVPAKLIGWPEIPSKRRKVLIATLEYEILDWKLKVKCVQSAVTISC
jgi:alpha-1,3-glucan synthase